MLVYSVRWVTTFRKKCIRFQLTFAKHILRSLNAKIPLREPHHHTELTLDLRFVNLKSARVGFRNNSVMAMNN
jgi:hypothetical protein